MAKDSRGIAFALLSSTLLAASTVDATSYRIIEEHRELTNRAVMTVGMTVYLFHSGTKDVRNALQVNDILEVYRDTPSCGRQKVGRIKVLLFSRQNYLKAEVVEGELKHGDIARKDAVSCLVLLTDDKCKH